jgi:hypothetical protein
MAITFASDLSALPLQTDFCHSLGAVSPSDWTNLLPGKGEDWAYFRTLEGVPPPGFRLGVIVVKNEGTVVAAAPVFRTVYRFDTSLQGRARWIGDRLYQHAPRLVSMQVLSLGSPLSDNSHIGLAPDLSADQRLAVIGKMLNCLKRQAKKEGIPLVSAKSLLTEEADQYEKAFTSCGYARVTTIPNVILELPYRDVDGYLASLPEGTASYLRRKWRTAWKVKIEHRTSIDDIKDEVNALYASTLAHSPVDYGNFGPVHPDYFAAVLRSMGERARLMLCWVDGELLSFQLYLVGRDTVLAKGIGMKYPKARDYNLYFINWKEMIDFCLTRGIPRISMSGTTYATKLLIGGRLEQRWILFRFQNSVVNWVLPWLAPAFDFESNDPELTARHARSSLDAVGPCWSTLPGFPPTRDTRPEWPTSTADPLAGKAKPITIG